MQRYWMRLTNYLLISSMKNIFPVLFILSFTATAQKMELLNGSLNSLKGQMSYDIKFSYDNMIIGRGKSEKDYLDEKKMLWEQKEPGTSKGSDFVKLWFEDRKNSYEPAFVKNFEQYARTKLNDKNATYTILLKTKRTEGGWNLGVASHSGEIDGELWIVESANHDKVIAKIAFFNIEGDNYLGGDFEMTWRINSAYKRAGTVLGYFVKKKSK